MRDMFSENRLSTILKGLLRSLATRLVLWDTWNSELV